MKKEKSLQKGNTLIVKKYILDDITKRRLKAGDMLEPEGLIASKLDLSMSSVRETTRALESVGIIEKKQGVGLMLRAFNMDVLSDVLKYAMVTEPSLIIDLYEIRKWLETELIDQIILHFTDSQYDALNNILAVWRQKIERHEPVYVVDQQFHETLFQKVQNALLISFSKVFWQIYEYMENNRLIDRLSPFTAENSRKTLENHEQILKLVSEKKSEEAKQLMRLHYMPIVENMKKELFEEGLCKN